MKKLILIAIVFIMLPLYAEWNAYDLTLVSTGISSEENSSKFELKDAEGRVFFVNAPGEPAGPDMKKILKYKNEIFSWKQVDVKELSFYMYEKGIQAAVVPSSVKYNGIDLKPNLPAGFTFIEGKDGLDYRYRIIVGNISLKLDGAYKGEGPLLKELHDYVRGIGEGKILVEDERVVSGSVVSIVDEKEKGEKHVHPIGDLPDFDKVRKKDGTTEERRPGEKHPSLAAVNAGEIFPLLHFGEMTGQGFGGSFSYILQDLFYNGLEGGIEAGIYYQRGKFDMEDENEDTDYAVFMPCHVLGGYRFTLTERFSMGPFVTFGFVYLHMSYTVRNRWTYVLEDKTVDETGGAVTAGFFTTFKLSESIYVNFRCSVGYLIASDLGMYVITDVGMLYRL